MVFLIYMRFIGSVEAHLKFDTTLAACRITPNVSTLINAWSADMIAILLKTPEPPLDPVASILLMGTENFPFAR